MQTYIYYIGLGSNLGDRVTNLRNALEHVAEIEGTLVMQVSSIYETEPMEIPDQPRFLNAVAQLSSTLDAPKMLRSLLSIEYQMGRTRIYRYGPRLIDLDILLCDHLIMESDPGLIVPHPKMHQRPFVLVPMAEIAPNVVHPATKKTIAELRDEVPGREGCHLISPSFPKRLRAYRRLKQLTQRDLADVMGVSVAIVGGLERGTRFPSEQELEIIVRALDVSREDLGLDPVKS